MNDEQSPEVEQASNAQPQAAAQASGEQPQAGVQASGEQPGAAAVAAVGFLVVAFLDEHAADQALDAMKEAKKRQQFYFEDAAVIRQDANGKVHYHETGDMSTGKGAGIGALVGGVLGILGGPAGVALGAGAGAAIGAAMASHDAGFRDESLNTVGVALRPGTSAVTAITSHEFLQAVQQQVPVEDIRRSVSNLATELSARLAENKNVAIGLLLTEHGLGIREIAVNEESAEVVGAVITDEAVAVGTVVATADGATYAVAVATEDGIVEESGVITDGGAEAALPSAAASATEAAAEAPAADTAPDEPAAKG